MSDVAWLMQYLGRITDGQLRAALPPSSGASPEETECFTAAIRSRIESLRSVSGQPLKRSPSRP